MRILHVSSDTRVGGAGRYLLNLLGSSVWQNDEVHLAAPNGPFLDAARHLGITTWELPGGDRSWEPSVAPVLRGILRQAGPFAVLHTHASLTARLVGRQLGIPVIATSHGPDGPLGHPLAESLRILLQPGRPNGSYWPSALLRPIHRLLAPRLADRIIAVSEAVRDLLLENGVPPDLVRVVPNGIEPAGYLHPDPLESQDFRRRFAPAGGPLLVVSARLVPEKGHAVLLRALSRLQPAFPGLRTAVVGEGPERPVLAALASELGLSANVVWAGFQTKVPEILAAADVFVLPSFQEGLPLAVLEAMAAGLPVVATAVGGTPEAVVDGQTGRLVPAGDEVALATALAPYLADPALAQAAGAAGRQRLLAHFTAKAMAEATRKVYEELKR